MVPKFKKSVTHSFLLVSYLVRSVSLSGPLTPFVDKKEVSCRRLMLLNVHVLFFTTVDLHIRHMACNAESPHIGAVFQPLIDLT